MAMYCDFDCYNPEQKTMFVLSYVLIVAFHPHLNLRKVIVQRSYRYSLEQLTMIDYLTNDQMSFIDVTLVKQLNDIAQEVSRRKWNNALGQMFVIETDLIKKHWQSSLINKLGRNIDNQISWKKNQYETKHPIDWQTNKCVICKMSSKIDPLGYDIPNCLTVIFSLDMNTNF